MSFKEYLQGSITNEAEFLRRLNLEGCYPPQAIDLAGKPRTKTWWSRREDIRLAEGVYKQTATVLAINQYTKQAYSLHVSNNNRNLVAYTPGKDFGERDKQLPTTLGKFLTKFIPALSDHEISGLVAEHEAELNPDVRWLTGDDLVTYYAEEASIKSCMTSSSDNKWPDKDTHPTQAYKIPGVRLAVLWKNGKDVARALTYENKDKKIFIRASYGDLALRNWLVSEGYVPGNWVGVEFNTIYLGDSKYVMPYLDADGGQGNSTNCSVALLDGKVTCVSYEVRQKLSGMGCCVVSATNTLGYVSLVNVETESFTYQDIVSGELSNKLTGSAVQEVYFGHIRGFTQYAANLPLSYVRMDINGNPVTANVVDGTLRVFDYAGRTYEDTDSLRMSLGYVKLDPVLYPDEQDWVVKGIVKLSDSRIVKLADCAVLLDSKGTSLNYVLRSEVPAKAYKLAKCQAYGPFLGAVVYAARDNPGLIVTRSGTRVCAVAHDVTKLIDDSWVPNRFAKAVRIDYMSITASVDKRDPSDSLLTKKLWDKGETWSHLRENSPQVLWDFAKHFAQAKSIHLSMDHENLRLLFKSQGYYYVRLQVLTTWTLKTEVAYKALQEIGALELEFMPGMAEVFAEKLKACNLWYAEATAIEYQSEPVQLPVLETSQELEVQNEFA